MKGKFAVLFALIALAVASAKSYTVTLHQPVMVGDTELKAGEYKVEVIDQKAVIRNGKTDAQAPVKVETSDSKYNRTSIRLSEEAGKMHLAEIRLGGTTTRLVFNN